MWLDDVRKAPPDFVWVKSYHEAIMLLETGTVEFASLDHDLPLDYELEDINPLAKTGYDVITWMEANDVWPINGVVCHSMNPSGRKRIEQVIEKKYGKA